MGGGVGRGRGRVGGGQGGCDRRIEVFGKIHKKKLGGGGGGRVGGWVGAGSGLWRGGGHGGCERRIEVFVKIQKKKSWGCGGSGGVGSEGRVRVDVKSLYEDRQHIYIIMSSFYFAWQLVAMDTSTAVD